MRRLPALLLLLPVLVGCAAEPAKEPPEAPDTERLLALGYVSWNRIPEDEAGKKGVVRHDPERTQPGLNLWNSLPRQRAVLMDAEGNEVHTWQRDTGGEWGHIELLQNGDLLIFHQGPDRLMRLDWNSNVVWERRMLAHHDGDVAENGDLYVLDRRRGLVRWGEEWVQIVHDDLVILSPDGEPKKRIPFVETLDAWINLDESPPEGSGRDGNGLRMLDPVHVNTLVILRDDHGGELRKGRVLFCSRSLNLIGVLDVDSGKTVWTWGRGELDGPHQPLVTPKGTIVVFDNGAARGWSRLLELGPATGEILWEYRGEPRESFYTKTMGGVQLLPNDHLLVTESERGHAFEIDRQGTIVWEFFNPDVDEASNERATFYRMQRVDEESLPGS